MWLWLKENHPIIHEVVQWAVLAIAVAALVNSCIILAREMGYCSRASIGDRWAQEHDVPAVRMGPRKRGYETDLVAKAIVQSRGMV